MLFGGADIDELLAELLRAGESTERIRALLAHRDPDEVRLLGLLRLAVPVRFLEYVSTTSPWSERPRLLGGVAGNPRTPRRLALGLLPSLFWRDLAEVAANPRLTMAVRNRAEVILEERLPAMRLGERVALGKIATLPVLRLLLGDREPKVIRAGLINPRLREEDLLAALRKDTAPGALIDEVAGSTRWSERYGIRLGLVLQPRTPLPLALAQISSLVSEDLARVAETPGLAPLVQMAARRVIEARGRG